MGPPIDAPDPLNKYRWGILGGTAAVLLIGGVYVASRPKLTARALRAQIGSSFLGTAMQLESDYAQSNAAVLKERQATVTAGSISILMNGIREELFKIEVEHKRGHLSQAEYEKARAALDQTLDRALKREVQKV